MRTLKPILIAALGSGALFAGLAVAPAAATPITFTWNPSATVATPLSVPAGNTTQFNADSITVSDYATIDTSHLNAVTENAILAVTAVDLVGPAGTVPFANFASGLGNGQGNGAFGDNAGATPYELYFVVSSTSTLAPQSGGGLAGQFTSLTYTLFGDVGGNCKFNSALSGPTATCGTDVQLTLATGNLAGGQNNASINSSGVPSADVDASVVAGANAGGFFVSPPITGTLDFASAFINNANQVSQFGTSYVITAGGGTVDLVNIPEPETVAIFGFGLMGLGWFVRRRSKNS